MNTQNFNQSDGFPLETETLDEMQKAYLFMQHFGHLAGNYSIISGCEVANGIVQNGAIFVAGELLEFKGSSLGTDVIIVQAITKNEFENATEKDVLTKRHATFGVGLNSIPWANFKRFKNIVELTTDKAEQTTIDLLLQRIVNLEARPAANVPIGLIAIWGSPLNTIPTGWAEHVPLRGRSPIGLDPDDNDLDSLGTAVGAKTKTLTQSNLPNPHGRDIYGLKFDGQDTLIKGDANINQPNLESQFLILPENANQPFSLLDPKRVVHFIKYTG